MFCSSKKQPANRNRAVLGITGGFGCGKTTVAKMFAACGARVVDADKIAHRLLRRGTKVYRRLVTAFGRSILKNGGSIDRVKLAEIAFAGSNSTHQLNRITHPEIIKAIRRKLSSYRRGIIVLDAPLLFESGLAGDVDRLIVVKASGRKQVERVRKKMRLSPESINNRIKQQIPLPQKIRLADFIIDNNGQLSSTRKQVCEFMKQLKGNIHFRVVA